MEPFEARLELARRFLHVQGPGSATGLANWAGIKLLVARDTFESLGDELIPVRTPLGEAWALASDEDVLCAPAGLPAPARLLPSGDSFSLMWGEDRALVVPDAERRDLLWTSRVWPGAVLVAGEVVGVWRRSKGRLTVDPWRRLTTAERGAIEAEATSMPLPVSDGEISVDWAD